MLRSDVIAYIAAGLSAAALHQLHAKKATIESAFTYSVCQIDASIADDRKNPLVAKTALPRLYHHGVKVANAVVLFHGFTNCPEQFDELARRLFVRGCNVYVPRLPFHGYRNRLTSALEALSVNDLTRVSSQCYALAQHLGDRVTALGLSLGGSMALYLAQTTPIDHAIAVAPFLMPIGISSFVGLPAMRALAWLPNYYVWWDPSLKERCRPIYAYPGFPTHALAEIVFFADAVLRASVGTAGPLGRHCTLVTNKSESAVNNSVAKRLIQNWRSSGAPYGSVSLDGLGSPRHDIIDPSTYPDARTLVYPKVEALVLDGPS
jgi:pimeloyl-ACP methyl ester carboxylesterase